MRRKRILEDGFKYHVSGRVNNRDHLLSALAAKLLLEMVIARAKKRFRFSVDNFSIMNNHYHLIICPDRGENLSRIMQWIMSVFAKAYNKMTGRSGHFWGERFYSQIIVNLLQYIRIFIYIDLNPVKAQLVHHPKEWIFCGLSHEHRGLYHIITPLPDELSMLLSTRNSLEY